MTMPWLCESVRLSALWQVPEVLNNALSWESAVGLPPEVREDQPRRGTSRHAGPIGEAGATLELQMAPGRIDWVMTAGPTLGDLSKIRTFSNIGAPQEALHAFDELLFVKAAQAYAAPRFAIGVVAMLPAKDRDASYADLAQLLRGLRPDLSGVSDFICQLNRPRKGKSVPELMINRLSRWSSVKVTGVQLVIPHPGAVGTIPEHRLSEPLHGTRVELDINSAAERAEEIPAQSRISLLKELGTLAMEVLEKGDIP